MSIQSSVGAPLAIQEKLPVGLMMPALSASSVVQGRSKARVVPSGAQSYTQAGASQMTINLQDQASYIDPASVCLNGNFALALNGSTDARLDDGIWSIFSRVRLFCNGVLVEDINKTGTSTNIDVLTSVPYGHYESALLPQALCTKFNRMFAPTDASGASTWNQKNQVAGRKAKVSAFEVAGTSFSMPLSYIFGMFRVPQFLPLRNMGVLQMVFDFAPVAQAFIADATSPLPTWSLTNVEVEYDALAIDARYVAVIDALCQDPSQAGWMLPHSTKTVMEASVATAGQKSIQYPIAKKHLRTLRLVSQPTADISALNKYSCSDFPPQSFASAYVQIGSARYPQNPCDTYAKAYNLLLDSHGLLGNVLAQPIPDFENYRGATLGAVSADANADLFVFGVNFDRLRNEDISHDGVSTGENGGQVIVYYNTGDATASTVTANFEYTQMLHIRAGAVSVTA